jgi:hypothetical protein
MPMNRLVPASSLFGTLLVSVLVGACSASGTNIGATESEDTASASEALSSGELAYFFADRAPSGDGYVVRPVNHARVACGRAPAAERCRVAQIDLSAFALADKDATAITSAVRDGWEPNTIVFVGSIDEDAHGARALRVLEAWRSPSATPWGGTLYHVTRDGLTCAKAPCTAAKALRLNAWRASIAPSIDLSLAPPASHCRFKPETSDACTGPYQLAEAAAATPTGLLVAAYRDFDGSLVVDQYFVHVGIGGTCDDGGLSYCNYKQNCMPDTGICDDNCVDYHCTHGRGRGVMPYERPFEVLTWMSAVTEIR